MITNNGKTIVAKYLLGQAPAYASYISVGCGAKPLSVYPSTEPALTNFKNSLAAKTNLDFEMFRVPITSRGFVNENGVSKIVFTAELPTEERYEVSEVGVYSAGSNPSAASFDSRILLGFTQSEPWESHVRFVRNGETSVTNNITSISFIGSALDTAGNFNNVIAPQVSTTITNISANGTTITFTASNNFVPGETVSITGVTPSNYNLSNQVIIDANTTTFKISSTQTGAYQSGGTATATVPVFQANSDNPIFVKTGRADKYERGRYYNNMLISRGDYSGLFLDPNTSSFIIPSESDSKVYAKMSKHVHLTGTKIDLTQNSPLDELRLAFSVLSKTAGVNPERIHVALEFSQADTSAEYARFEGQLVSDEIDPTNGVDFDNRYFVVKKKLQELITTSGFNWNNVTTIKAYASSTRKKTVAYKQRVSNVVTIGFNESGYTPQLQAGDVISICEPASYTNRINGTFIVKTFGLDTGTGLYFVTFDNTGTDFGPNSGLTDPLRTIEYLDKNSYIAFDGLRLENVTTQNPLYGLVGYSIVKTDDAETIIKNPNSNNYIEYRFNLDVT